MMGHLEEQPDMNVFQNQVMHFPESFILSIKEYYFDGNDIVILDVKYPFLFM